MPSFVVVAADFDAAAASSNRSKRCNVLPRLYETIESLGVSCFAALYAASARSNCPLPNALFPASTFWYAAVPPHPASTRPVMTVLAPEARRQPNRRELRLIPDDVVATGN